jgi:dimethylamine/trimethylamine dehydrogenase
MPREARHDVLFEPVRIGPKTLRNRFFQVPHCTGFGTTKPGSQAAHRGVKAEGGWAGVCTEDAPVSHDSDESPYAAAHVIERRDSDNLAMVAEHAHRYGALAGVELTHAGAHAETNGSRWPAIAPSQLASDFVTTVVAKEMELADIRRVQDDWARAAEQAVAAGFDIVYVYGAHAYLPGQFLSTYYNHRSDVYGGSLENRSRFWIETLERVREAVAGKAAVAVRIAVGLTPGLTMEDALGFVRLADPLVDLWDVCVGSLAEWSLDSGTSRFHREGYQLEWTGRVREATTKPIVGVGRLTSPDRMAEIVRSRALDIIGAARPSIADPFLPEKVEQGRYGEIRECTGSNVCIARVVRGGHLGCIQNPTAGEEYRRGWHPERVPPLSDTDRDYLVVGAGPAGMECAIVLGKRGARRVHLVDGESEVGGAMRWITLLPGLAEWGRVVNWRRIQLDCLRNVEVLNALQLNAAGVQEYGSDVVVLATGSHWAADGRNAITHGPIPGAGQGVPRVLIPEQVVRDGLRPPGRRVVVYDAEGYFTGPGVAQLLAMEGFKVELVPPFGVVSPASDLTLEGPELRRALHADGIAARRDTALIEIAGGRLVVEDAFGERDELVVDGVVLVTQRISDDRLYHELTAEHDGLASAGIQAVYRIGDCVAPRSIADCIFDGHRLAREIDGDHPDVPLPHRIEIADRATLSRLA